MLLWFVATSLVAMRWCFGDPAIDHRLIVAGALLPDVLHAVTGGAPIVHSLACRWHGEQSVSPGRLLAGRTAGVRFGSAVPARRRWMMVLVVERRRC